MKKKLACIVGARPQFIKYAILRPCLERFFDIQLLHTGQHTAPALSHDIFNDLQIPPPDLQLSTAGDTREERLAEMQVAIEIVLRHSGVHAIVVFGDTDSTLAGARAAHRCKVPLIHIEAGERSHNPTMPEEANRLETDQLSALLCCVSGHAEQHLLNERLPGRTVNTGDLMKDLLMKSLPLIRRLSPGPYYYASLHRNYTRSRTETLTNLFAQINSLKHPVIFSLHPSTAKAVSAADLQLANYGNINFIEPVPYHQSISYQKYAEAVITDSGGMQKEAYWLRVPCITLRPETEWVETLTNNCNQLYYLDGDLGQLLGNQPSNFNQDLYGSGNAAERITSAIKDLLQC